MRLAPFPTFPKPDRCPGTGSGGCCEVRLQFVCGCEEGLAVRLEDNVRLASPLEDGCPDDRQDRAKDRPCARDQSDHEGDIHRGRIVSRDSQDNTPESLLTGARSRPTVSATAPETGIRWRTECLFTLA